MSPRIGCLIWSVCAVVLLIPSPADATEFTTQPGSVDQWLVLGPVVDAFPVFHAESRGGYDLDALRSAARFQLRSLRPAEGGVEQWFGGEDLRWTARVSNSDGTIRLDAPSSRRSDQSAVAWLAVNGESRSDFIGSLTHNSQP